MMLIFLAVICLDGDGCKLKSGLVKIEEGLTLDKLIACDSCDLCKMTLMHHLCKNFEDEFIESCYPECSSASERSAPCCRSLAVIETSKMILLRGQLRVRILAAQMSTSSPVVGRHLETSCYMMPARSCPFLKNQLLKRVFALENCEWSRPILPNLQICFNLVFRISFRDKSPGIKEPKRNAENRGDDFQNNKKESTTKMRSDLLQFRAAQVILSSDFTNLMDPEHRGELPPDSFSASSNAFPGYVYNAMQYLQDKTMDIKLRTQQRASVRAGFNYLVAYKTSWLEYQQKQLETMKKVVMVVAGHVQVWPTSSFLGRLMAHWQILLQGLVTADVVVASCGCFFFFLFCCSSLQLSLLSAD